MKQVSAADAHSVSPPDHSGQPEYTSATVRVSVESMLHHQDENGSFIASPDFAQYHFCWLRDASFVAYALDLAGEHEAASRYHAWVGRTIGGISDVIDRAIEQHRQGQPLNSGEMPPARFGLDGSIVIDDWPNFQIDGYGTWLWALGQHLRVTDRAEMSASDSLRDSVERAAEYIAAFGFSPCYDVWEESGGAVHTSTLGCVYGGLTAAASLLKRDVYAEVASAVQAFVRERAQRVGIYEKSSESGEVDASTLWLAMPFGLVTLDDRLFEQTVLQIEERLTLGGGIRRYPSDTYYGGGAWPVLTASLGWYHSAVGDLAAARRCRDWVSARFEADGRLAEQFSGEERDPEHFDEWLGRWGRPARELLWSHAMHVVLCDTLDGDVLSHAKGSAGTDSAGQGKRSISTVGEGA
jgi:GH15 family glucan-1,4-alpha-glucosidase